MFEIHLMFPSIGDQSQPFGGRKFTVVQTFGQLFFRNEEFS